MPQRFVPRIFDPVVDWQPGDFGHLRRFVKDLVALERKSLEGAMKAIRRYVIGAHRMSDDANVAYALLVMSVESLAQKFDGFGPAWDDYDDPPSTASLGVHLVLGQHPDWGIPALEELHLRYWRERYHAKSLKLVRPLEAAFALTLAEENRKGGDIARARELVAFAVEAYPDHKALRSFEQADRIGEAAAIDWRAILLPAEATGGQAPRAS